MIVEISIIVQVIWMFGKAFFARGRGSRRVDMWYIRLETVLVKGYTASCNAVVHLIVHRGWTEGE
jgi:hypothetical protein